MGSASVGSGVTSTVGSGVGASVGSGVTSTVGSGVGASVGSGVTSTVGSGVGASVGSGVTSTVGSGVTSAVGSAVGSTVGCSVISGEALPPGSLGTAASPAVATAAWPADRDVRPDAASGWASLRVADVLGVPAGPSVERGVRVGGSPLGLGDTWGTVGEAAGTTVLSTAERNSHAPATPAAPTASTSSAMTATARSLTGSGTRSRPSASSELRRNAITMFRGANAPSPAERTDDGRGSSARRARIPTARSAGGSTVVAA